MKRNFLYLCTLMCMVGLFAAGCSSKDDEVTPTDNSWEKLPSGQIAAEKVTMDLNGDAATGNIVFKALSAASAQIELKNVIDGYNDVSFDAKMTKQADGSFLLSAAKDIESKPSIASSPSSRAASAMLMLNVDGKVTADGRFTLSISAEGPGLFIGTYKGDNLVLTYTDKKLSGYEVVFDGTKGDNVTITLKNIIPGEEETVLDNIEYANGAFNGTADTDNASVVFSGSRANKVLTLDLDVTMNDPSGVVGEYMLNDYVVADWEYLGSPMKDWPMSGAMFMDWTWHENSERDDPYYVQIWSGLFRGIGSIMLPQVLKGVAIEADGNISAMHQAAPTIIFDPMWATMGMFGMGFPTKEMLGPNWIPEKGWVESPARLASWFVKDGQFFLKLNIREIIENEMPDNPEMVEMIMKLINESSAAELKAMAKVLVDLDGVSDATFEQLLGWVRNGIPMKVEKKDNRMIIALDEHAFNNIMSERVVGVDEDGENIMTSDLNEVVNALSAAGLLPAEAAAMTALIPSITPYWQVTDSFRLGFDLVKK